MTKKIKIIGFLCVISFLLGGCGIKDKIKLYFTTDLKQNDENLDESLTEFVLNEETGKYKIKNTKIKLLD